MSPIMQESIHTERTTLVIRRNKKGAPSVVVTMDNANDLAASYDAIRDEARHAIALFGTEVSAEIEKYETLPANDRAARVAIFALLSAQGDFGPNCDAIAPILAYLRGGGTDPNVIHTLLAGVRYGCRSMAKCENAAALADFVNTSEHVDRDFLYRHMRGFGLKTSAMAAALFDHRARVITLDSWMLNGIAGLRTTNRMNKYAVTYNDAAYKAIETLLLTIADDLNVPPFTLQWCMWNMYRGGTHESHLRIFGL